jgi:hypothetical protein
MDMPLLPWVLKMHRLEAKSIIKNVPTAAAGHAVTPLPNLLGGFIIAGSPDLLGRLT